jgi:hypothetical protein
VKRQKRLGLWLGGAIHLLDDARARFVSEAVDDHVYVAVATREDEETGRIELNPYPNLHLPQPGGNNSGR